VEVLSKVLLVGSGGFIGANARYWLIGSLQARLGSTLPWGTFIINVTGALVIGFFFGLLTSLHWSPRWGLFFAIGVLGGYTTFSSFAYDAVKLLLEKEYGWALFYIEGSAAITVFAAWLGLVLSRLAVAR
jgi:CrcB protein